MLKIHEHLISPYLFFGRFMRPSPAPACHYFIIILPNFDRQQRTDPPSTHRTKSSIAFMLKSICKKYSNTKNRQKTAILRTIFPQKYCKYYNIFCIDISILRLYYRGSFWINLLSRSQKQTSIPKYNSTLHTEDPVFLAVTGSSLFYVKNTSKNRLDGYFLLSKRVLSTSKKEKMPR